MALGRREMTVNQTIDTAEVGGKALAGRKAWRRPTLQRLSMRGAGYYNGKAGDAGILCPGADPGHTSCS
jgi:hypothetical protein